MVSVTGIARNFAQSHQGAKVIYAPCWIQPRQHSTIREVNTGWNSAAEWPRLETEHVHVWAVLLPAWRHTLNHFRAALPREELQRNEKFRRPLHRERDLLS